MANLPAIRDLANVLSRSDRFPVRPASQQNPNRPVAIRWKLLWTRLGAPVAPERIGNRLNGDAVLQQSETKIAQSLAIASI